MKKKQKQRIQGCIYFFTPNQLLLAKQAPTPPIGRQTRPLFLTLIRVNLPKIAKADKTLVIATPIHLSEIIRLLIGYFEPNSETNKQF